MNFFFKNKYNILFLLLIVLLICLYILNLSNINLLNKIIICFVLFIITIIIIYQNILKSHKLDFEKNVSKRTKQIQCALDELEKVNFKLYELAHTDFLTKIMNRRSFFLHAQNLFDKCHNNHCFLNIVMIDLDNFKKINDTYGHNIGDQVLVLFTQNIQKNINDNVLFGRLGGEEFALVYKNISLEHTINEVEKLRQNIEKASLVTHNGIINITASFGISDNSRVENIDEMLQKADKHLYNAKHSGKNLIRSRLSLI